jgi:hypothetical protein
MAVLEASRVRVRWLFAQVAVFLVAPLAWLALRQFDIVPGRFESVWTLPFIALLLVCAAGVYLRGRIAVPEFRGYRGRFKNEVVGELLRTIVPMSDYAPAEGIGEPTFDASRLFKKAGTFASVDRLRGRLEGTEFEAAYARRTYRRRNRRNKSETVPVFEGLFFRFDLDRELAGRTFVDSASARDTQLGEREGLEKVEVAHPAFAKAFVVSSTEPAEAQSLLTATLVEQIEAYRARTGHVPSLSFLGNRAYLAIQTGTGVFEPDIATTTSREELEAMADPFGLAEHLVRELRVSSRFRRQAFQLD